MKKSKLFKKIQPQRIALTVALLVGSISVGGGLYYRHRQNQLSLQREQAAIAAAKEKEQLALQEPATNIDSSAGAIEQKASTVAPQPTAPKTSQHPSPVFIDKKKVFKLTQGGTLIPDQGSITFYKNQTRPSVTFTTSDGAAIRFPSTQWYDSRPYGFVASTIPDEKRSTWTVQIDASNMPVGVFKAEAVSIVNDAQGNSVQYTGSVMVNVVESPY